MLVEISYLFLREIYLEKDLVDLVVDYFDLVGFSLAQKGIDFLAFGEEETAVDSEVRVEICLSGLESDFRVAVDEEKIVIDHASDCFLIVFIFIGVVF